MAVFQNRKFRSTAHASTFAARYRAMMAKRPFLLFGLPFMAVMIAGSFVLTPATAIRYERHDRRVRQLSKEEELGVGKSGRRIDLREEYYVSSHLLFIFSFRYFCPVTAQSVMRAAPPLAGRYAVIRGYSTCWLTRSFPPSRSVSRPRISTTGNRNGWRDSPARTMACCEGSPKEPLARSKRRAMPSTYLLRLRTHPPGTYLIMAADPDRSQSDNTADQIAFLSRHTGTEPSPAFATHCGDM